MYAIIETGGKQYRVAAGDVIRVEKLAADVGEGFVFDKVLMISGDDSPQFGTPFLDGATVAATVLDHDKAKKVVAFKYKAKKGYRKKKGHRQPFTSLRIETIG